MIIALTGTPGTGKTTVCGIIREHSQYGKQFHIIDLNRLVIDGNLYTEKDRSRNSYIADLEKLKIRVEEIIDQSPQGIDVIMEGHLSHYLTTDAVIVLRAAPIALRKRLGKRRDYSFEKIKENANAEALDVILVESLEKSSNVYEINTTDMNPLAIVKSIISIIEALRMKRLPEEFIPGKINWIDQVEQ